MPHVMYFPYIDPTNYTEFINNDVKSTAQSWIIANVELIVIYAILLFVIRLAWVTKGQNYLPLLVYLSLLATYFFVYKNL